MATFSAIAAIILDIAYGYDIFEKNDPLIDMADSTLQELVSVLVPGAYLVDSIPACSYLFSQAKAKTDH